MRLNTLLIAVLVLVPAIFIGCDGPAQFQGEFKTIGTEPVKVFTTSGSAEQISTGDTSINVETHVWGSPTIEITNSQKKFSFSVPEEALNGKLVRLSDKQIGQPFDVSVSTAKILKYNDTLEAVTLCCRKPHSHFYIRSIIRKSTSHLEVDVSAYQPGTDTKLATFHGKTEDKATFSVVKMMSTTGYRATATFVNAQLCTIQVN